MYSPATNKWTVLAPLLEGKSEPSSGLLGKTIVAADGFTNSGDNADNEGYNVSTNTWSSWKADPSPRHASCFGVISGKLYIAGGYDSKRFAQRDKCDGILQPHKLDGSALHAKGHFISCIGCGEWCLVLLRW